MNSITDEKAFCEDAAFGCYSGGVLEKFTHSETPWQLARQGSNDDEPSQNIITKSSISEFFGQVLREYDVKGPEDISKYSRYLFSLLIDR